MEDLGKTLLVSIREKAKEWQGLRFRRWDNHLVRPPVLWITPQVEIELSVARAGAFTDLSADQYLTETGCVSAIAVMLHPDMGVSYMLVPVEPIPAIGMPSSDVAKNEDFWHLKLKTIIDAEEGRRKNSNPGSING